MDRDRPEPTIFSAFHDALAEAYSSSILGPLAEEMAGETGRGAPSWYGRTKSSLHDKLKSASSSGEMTEVHSLLAGALETAVAKLKAWLGEEMSEWTWGRVHRTSPRHALSSAFPNLAQELNPPSVGTHGDGFTPLAGSYSAAEPYILTSASMARYVFDASDWETLDGSCLWERPGIREALTTPTRPRHGPTLPSYPCSTTGKRSPCSPRPISPCCRRPTRRPASLAQAILPLAMWSSALKPAIGCSDGHGTPKLNPKP